MNNRYAKKALAAAIFAGLALSSAASHAATINTLFGGGVNTIQDQDAERFFDSEGNVKTSGSFAVGDRIEAILRFDSVNSGTISDSLPAPYQLLGYNQMRISNIIDIPDFIVGQDLVRLIFGYNAAGINGINLMPAGSVVELYERTDNLQPGYTADLAPATGITNVRNQTLIGTLGFGDANDFWGATLINDITLLSNATLGGGQAAAGEFGLSLLGNPGSLPILNNGILSGAPVSVGGGGMHDVVGDVSVYARETGVNDGWLVSSNINASFNANAVPEPGTIAMMGLGLLGLAGFVRRRAGAATAN